MGAPRYLPKDYCDRPDEFGLSHDLRFKPLPLASSDDPRSVNDVLRHLENEAFAVAAQWQHEHALVIRQILDRRGISFTAYADLVGEHPKRVRSILCGLAVMRRDDIERANQTLGASVSAVIQIHERARELRAARIAMDEIGGGRDDSRI